MKRSLFRKVLMLLGVLLPTVACAGSVGVGSVGVGSVGVSLYPSIANVYSGPDLGVQVRVLLYPAGMKTPPNSKVTFGRIGSTSYAMLVSPDSSSEPGAAPPGIDEHENLRSDLGFQSTMSRKLVRIVVDTRQSKHLESELRSADKPIGLEGWVSDSASPILTVLQIETAPHEAHVATSPAMELTNPVALRASQIRPN
jgi:hypothetical protein